MSNLSPKTSQTRFILGRLELICLGEDQIRKVLCDPDPSVMGASLHVLCEAWAQS